MLFDKNISKEEIRRISRKGSQLLYPTGELLPAPETSPDPIVSEPDDGITNSAAGSTPVSERGSDGSCASSPYSTSKVSKDAIRLLKHWLSSPELFVPQSVLFRSFGITSGAKQAKLKHEVVAGGLVLTHDLPTRKNKWILWEATDKGWLVTGLEQPINKSKGGFLHQGLANLIAKTARKKGYRIEIESFQSNGKAIDLVLRKGEEVIWIELGMSDAENELSNVLKDLASGITPTKLIMACRDSKMKARLQELIAGEPSLVPFRDRIEVVLAGNLISFEQA